ncbi:MAG: YesL family protein [Bifidobacteriaceae bacterium]|jgi:uncharacterized membrane protein YesL|nr:YesL family protein [Bifidobacteriaceae bacterium]
MTTTNGSTQDRPGPLTALRGRYVSVVEVVGGLLLATLMWLVCLVGVVTAPAGTAALFGLVRYWRRNGIEGWCATEFIQEFRRSFGQASRLGALLATTWAVVGLGSWGLFRRFGQSFMVLAPLTVAAALLGGLTVFIWVVMADYDAPDRAVLRTAASLVASHPGATAVAVGALAAAAFAVAHMPTSVLLFPGPLSLALYVVGHGALVRSLVAQDSGAST